MAMIEQNISGIKLEKLRQKAQQKLKFSKKLFKIIFVFCLLLSMLKPRNIGMFFMLTSGEPLDAGSIAFCILMIFMELMLAFTLALAAKGIYVLVFWKKAYNTFNDNYKNKYALLKMREIPGFSDLKYAAQQGIPYPELLNVRLIPNENKLAFESKDYFEGEYNEVHFRASTVNTYEAANAAAALFEGQVIVFSSFHKFKISESEVQIFPKKEAKNMKGFAFGEKIETENEAFNNKFSVYTKDGQNAFYILTPQVIEDILEFAEIINDDTYIVFYKECMYVGCRQFRSPFDAFIDQPVEEQSRNIVKAADIIQKAREILIHIENQ